LDESLVDVFNDEGVPEFLLSDPFVDPAPEERNRTTQGPLGKI
jgi:hypothetical protein